MKGWKSYLLWEGLPFLILLSINGAIAAINWDYEKKLISVDNSASGWTGMYMGPILLAIALAMALIATLLLWVVRVTKPQKKWTPYILVSLVIITLFLILPSLFITVLGPAGITMSEQMRAMSK